MPRLMMAASSGIGMLPPHSTNPTRLPGETLGMTEQRVASPPAAPAPSRSFDLEQHDDGSLDVAFVDR